MATFVRMLGTIPEVYMIFGKGVWKGGKKLKMEGRKVLYRAYWVAGNAQTIFFLVLTTVPSNSSIPSFYR